MSRAVLTEAQVRKILAKSSVTVTARRPMSERTKAAIMDVAQAAIRELSKEASIEDRIVEAMELDGWRAFKMEENFSERKFKKTGEPGMCDHLFLRPHNQGDPRGPVPYTKTRCYNPLGDILWWEFKASREIRKRAEFLSAKQVKWIMAERAKGFLVWAAGEEADYPPTAEGCARKYLDSGLCRRREAFERLAA